MIEVRDKPLKWDRNDLVALHALDALGVGYVPWSSWSMRPAAVATLVNQIAIDRPAAVVELGAGASTFYLARAAAAHGCSFVSIEDDRRWCDAMVRLAADANVVHVPLAPLAPPVTAGTLPAPERWYDVQALTAVLPERIDLLVVDGPAAGDNAASLVRSPAVPILADRLASRYTIALDDAKRAGEREAAVLWQERLGCRLLFLDRTGLAVLLNHDDIVAAL